MTVDTAPRRAEFNDLRLRFTTEAGTLAAAGDAPREWAFPNGDEVFRGIYTRAGMGFSNEVLTVCSAIAGEGKTTVAVGLAVALAQDFRDRRVLLVETDLQRPILAHDFGVDADPGLVDCLINRETLQSACRPTWLQNLHVVPAGSSGSMPGRPLRSSQMTALLDAMRRNYHTVILDLPPLLANSDAGLLTDLADGVICVVRSGVTPAALVNRALQQVDDAKLRGIVLNGTTSAVPGWLRRFGGF